MRVLPSFRRALMAVALLAVVLSAAPANAKPNPSVVVSATTPKAVERGSWSTVTVRITNRTSRTVRDVAMSVVPPKGVTVQVAGARAGSRRRTVPSVGPRRSTTVVVRLRSTATTAPTSKVTIRVTRSGRVVAERRVTMRITDRHVTPGTGPGNGARTPSPGVAANPLVGRYFYDVSSLDEGAVYRAYYFADARFVYRGTPRGGLPVCTAATAVGSGDGCLAYRYSAATREFTVGGLTGTTSGPHSLSLGDISLVEAVAPAAARTFATTVSNLCVTDCQTMSFTADGRFTRTTTALEDLDGEHPVIEQGSYRVEVDGRLVLVTDAGNVSSLSILVFLNEFDVPDVQEGLILDGVGFMGPASGMLTSAADASDED